MQKLRYRWALGCSQGLWVAARVLRYQNQVTAKGLGFNCNLNRQVCCRHLPALRSKHLHFPKCKQYMGGLYVCLPEWTYLEVIRDGRAGDKHSWSKGGSRRRCCVPALPNCPSRRTNLTALQSPHPKGSMYPCSIYLDPKVPLQEPL